MVFVEVFKTNIAEKKAANRVMEVITYRYPLYKITLANEGQGLTMRVADAEHIDVGCIIRVVIGLGHSIEWLKK
jgi:hypothetical protein